MAFARLSPVYPQPSWSLRGLDPFRQVRAEMMRRMRQALDQSMFSRKARAAFSKALSVKTTATRLTVSVSHPGWLPWVQGQQRRQMTWLTKAKGPIPIVTETGETIFRSATPRSMANGKWVHPGRTPSTFPDKARAEVRRFLREKFARHLGDQVRQALGR